MITTKLNGHKIKYERGEWRYCDNGKRLDMDRPSKSREAFSHAASMLIKAANSVVCSVKDLDAALKISFAAMDKPPVISDHIEYNPQGPKTLNDLRDMIHKNAVDHGWWESDRDFGEIVALCHSELSEALEEYRDGNKPGDIYFIKDGQKVYGIKDGCKPEGMAIEMADCIIRILDWFGKERLDVGMAIRIKNEYNMTRPYKHGGKKI